MGVAGLLRKEGLVWQSITKVENKFHGAKPIPVCPAACSLPSTARLPFRQVPQLRTLLASASEQNAEARVRCVLRVLGALAACQAPGQELLAALMDCTASGRAAGGHWPQEIWA
jgi:hypothetical protein